MKWCEIFPDGTQPSLEDMAHYIGGDAAEYWTELLALATDAYKIKPKLTYSGCSMQPGWNVKLAKSGQTFGTLYPMEGSYLAFLVIPYRLEGEMDQLAVQLSEGTAKCWKSAGDFMKMGHWMMLSVSTADELRDMKLLMTLKLGAPKGKA